MDPLPEEIGPVQFTIRRDQSGVNRFAPKYYLTLVESNSQVLSAAKIQSLSTHMQIKVDSPYVSYIAKGQETMIVRLLGESGYKLFYIFDSGTNPKDIKPVQKLAVCQRDII